MAFAERPIDGRTARRHRTREAIVRAVTELLEEGDLVPTGARIAARAGVSLRSINVHFADREALLDAVAQVNIEHLLAGAERIPREGPLDDRLDAFVEQRARILEGLTPLRRASLLHEPFSPALQARTAEATRLGRREVAAVFARELEPDGEPDRELLHAVGVVTSWFTWHSLREAGLSPGEARAALRRMLASLLTPR